MSIRSDRDKEYKRLFAEYKKLAKRADQRLVRLEKLSNQAGFEHVTEWAYRKAQKNIQYWSGENATRFNVKPPNDIQLLKAKMRDIQEFLAYKTSTKKGILEVYKKRADTLNKKYGTDFTWEDLANYFERKTHEKLDKEYGSKTMLKAIGQIQANEDKIISDIKSGRNVDLKISNKKVNQVVNDLVASYGVNVVDLY